MDSPTSATLKILTVDFYWFPFKKKIKITFPFDKSQRSDSGMILQLWFVYSLTRVFSLKDSFTEACTNQRTC